jgi:protein required for attachment to host cells
MGIIGIFPLLARRYRSHRRTQLAVFEYIGIEYRGDRFMHGRKTHPNDLVVVCDGRKAMILENIGDAKFPNLQMREVLEQEDPATHEQGTAAPGRVYQSVGPARSAVAQTNWHDLAERGFLGTLAQHLNAAVARDPIKSVTVVAAPRALGMLRQAYSPTLRGAIVDELDKDWVKMPIWQIERRLHQVEPRLH